MQRNKTITLNIYNFAVFFAVAFVSCFLALNLVPLLTKTGDSSAEEISDSIFDLSIATSGNVSMQIENPGSLTTASHTVSVATNCPVGYNLYIQAGPNSQGINDNKMYQNADSSSQNFINPTTHPANSPGNLEDNQWGFSLDYYEGIGGFAAVPTVQEKLLIPDDPNSASGTTSHNIELIYGVKTGHNLSSGIYATTVLYSVMPKPDCYNFYNVSFDAGDDATGSYPDKKMKNGDKLNLASLAMFFSKPDHEIDYWVDQDGNQYDATSESIDINPNLLKQVTLTAHWKDARFKNAYINAGKQPHYVQRLGSYYTMQDMSGAICDAVPTPDKTEVEVPEITLIDLRDYQLYIVRKLADGNCWMAQNLRFRSAGMVLTQEDSDVISEFTVPSSVDNFTNESNNNEIGRLITSDPAYNNGVYYSWYAATAGTGTAKLESGNALSSICPKGWQLPSSNGANKSYTNLITTTYEIKSGTTSSFTTIAAMPLEFGLTGRYTASGFTAPTMASYHTSTAISDVNINVFSYISTIKTFSTTGTSPKYSGEVARCVARDDPENTSSLTQALKKAGAPHISAADGKEYYAMQGMTNAICNAVSTPAKDIIDVPEATMIDARDGELYTVRKLADGNCWMTNNLRFQLSTEKALTSADSDVASSWTPDLNSQTTTGTTWGDFDSATDVNKARSYVDTTNKEYGGYYNWYAATAGTGTYEMNDRLEARSSICPKGWKLPSTSHSYSLIYAYYNDNSAEHNGTILNKPLSFSLSGNYYGDTGSIGYWWSDAGVDGNNLLAANLNIDRSYVYSQRNYNKINGFSVRCVAQ